MSILYVLALIFTVINLLEVKRRVHTRVLLRTQVIMIVIESFRLITAVTCIVQMYNNAIALSVTFQLALITSECS